MKFFYDLFASPNSGARRDAYCKTAEMYLKMIEQRIDRRKKVEHEPIKFGHSISADA
jgi:hypothetical protein